MSGGGGGKKRVLPSLAAGAVAGAVAKTVIAPLDRTKINFQVSSRKFSVLQAVWFIRKRYHREGLWSLWRGNSATLARVVPYAALQFMFFEQYKTLLKPAGRNSLTPLGSFTAGSLAGLTATLITYPLDMMRARMAVMEGRRSLGLLAAYMEVARSTGRSFYRGALPTLIGIVPYAGLSFFTFETLKRLYLDREQASPPVVLRLAFGAVAGLVGQTSSYPLDIVRRRMQTEGLVKGSHFSYRSISSSLQHIWRTEGLRGLFKGVSMNWIKGPLVVTISFNMYEFTLRIINNTWK